VLADAKAQLNVLLTNTTTEGKVFHRVQELQLERAHIPFFPLFWTLMHVLDERSPLNGYDAARAVKANAQVFVTIEARDPTLATTVHDIRNYPAEDIRFGMRSREAVTTARDGTPVLDLTTIGALEPDVGDRQEQGWTERERAAHISAGSRYFDRRTARGQGCRGPRGRHPGDRMNALVRARQAAQADIRSALRRRRRALGLTQEQAAQLLGMHPVWFLRVRIGGGAARRLSEAPDLG